MIPSPGYGYLSMFLAELLPAHRFERIVLLDKAWPMHSQENPSAGQINPEHVFLDYWPIRMTTSKNNLKTPGGRRCIAQHVLDSAPGAVIVLGIHLCGQLSVRAVELFNTHPSVTMLAVKPCCLPQVWAGLPPMIWTFANGTQLDAQDVGIKGRFVKNVWKGPPRATMVIKFKDWGDRLYAGIGYPEGSWETDGSINGWKESEDLELWSDTGAKGKHYQNRYLWAYKQVGSVVPICEPCTSASGAE